MIITLESFLQKRNDLIEQNSILVFTNGCFDLVHRGHIEYLNQSKKMGDILIIGLNTDDSVKRLKGKDRPILPLEDRAYILDNLKPVDFVIPFDEDTPIKLIESISPNILVKGGDYTIESIVGNEWVIANSGKVVTIPYIAGQSTTAIIDRIKRI